MKKFIALLFTLSLLPFGVRAQTFAPGATTKTTASVPASSGGKAQATPAKESLFDENGVPKYIVKNLDRANLEEEKQYDNSDRKVFSFKMVDGEIVLDDAPRSILISYENYKINQSFDNLTRCSLRIYVLNDLMERVTNLGVKLHWPDISTTVQMNRLNPGVRTYKDIVLMGDGCFNLDKIPTIEINSCRVKDMTKEQCADAVKWYQPRRNQN